MAANTFTRGYNPNASGGVTGDNQTAVDNSSYIPELYSKKVLYDFYAQTVFKEICNTDYEGELKKSGDTVRIRQAPHITTNVYHPGGDTPLSYQNPFNDDITMTADQSQYTAFKVDSVDKFQSDIDLMNMYATDAASRLAVEVDREVLEAFVDGAAAANRGASAGAISGNLDFGTDEALSGGTGPLQIIASGTEDPSANKYLAVDTLVRLGQGLDEQNIPVPDRWVVIPAWYATKLKTSELKQANITGDSTGVIRNGLIGEINGMKIFVNNNLPTGSVNTSAHVIYAGTKAACAFAMQMSVTESGKLENQFGEYMRTLWVYGRKVVRPEALVQAVAMAG